MISLKGTRFSFPIVRRYSILKHLGTYAISWNSHPGMEIHYVLKGEISWNIEGLSKPLAVPGGYFGFVPKGVKHRALEGLGTPAERIGVIFEAFPDMHCEGTLFSKSDVTRIFSRFNENAARTCRITSRLAIVLRRIHEMSSLDAIRNPDGQLQLRILLSSLIVETYQALDESEALASGHEVIPQILKWIDLHITEEIPVKKLVQLSGYGRCRFFSLFLANTGMSPNNYITRKRVNRAKRKLRNRKSVSSILEIAMDCGFKSASVFSSTFAKLTGVSPRAFRNRIKAPAKKRA